MEQTTAGPARKSLIPSAWYSTIREVGMAERAAAGLSLAHAFATDPLSVYLLDGDDMADRSAEYIWGLHVRIMTYTFAAYRIRGIVTTIGPDYDAIAMWTPPGKFMDDFWATFWSGTWRLSYELPREARKRFFDELVPALHNTREETMGARNNSCYYLGYIGTKPSARGKGYASKLIRAMTDKADAENRPMYLESSAPENNTFYAKFGFEIKTRIELKRGPVPVCMDCMVREPQASQLRDPETQTQSSDEGPKE